MSGIAKIEFVMTSAGRDEVGTGSYRLRLQRFQRRTRAHSA